MAYYWIITDSKLASELGISTLRADIGNIYLVSQAPKGEHFKKS